MWGKGNAKTCFSKGQAVYVHYFKDIRQGARVLRADSDSNNNNNNNMVVFADVK